MSILNEIFNYLEEIKNGQCSFQKVMNKGLKKYSKEDAFLIKDTLKSVVNRYYFLLWELNKIFPVKNELTQDYLVCALSQYHYVNLVTDEQLERYLKEDLPLIDETISVSELVNRIRDLGGVQLKISDRENEILVKRLAINYSYPEWVCKMISKHFGFKKAYKTIASSRKSVKLALNVNTFLTSAEDLIDDYPDLFEKGILSDNTLRFKGKDKLIELEPFKNNYIFVEDEASQLLVNSLNIDINDTCLLLCGDRITMALDMAMKLKDLGTVHTCTDNIVDFNSLRNMSNRFKLHSLDIFESNVSQLITHVGKETCDKVLFVAKSSSLGVVRRRPDVLLTLKRNELDEIINNEKQELSEVSDFVKSGGLLEYAVFTYSRKESTEVIEDFLSKHEDFELLNDRQIFSFEAPSDGVYFALLRRK